MLGGVPEAAALKDSGDKAIKTNACVVKWNVVS